jgi:hypothetical protein
MMIEGQIPEVRIQVGLPRSDHHKSLIACQVACPVHTDARGYVRAIANGDLERAYLIARGPNPFASICGRICGAPCELSCRRGKIPRTDDDGFFVATDRPIAIRALKRFVCESYGAEARPAGQVLAALRGCVPGFVGYLFLKEAYARTQGNCQGAAIAKCARERFINEHVARCAGSMCKRLGDGSAHSIKVLLWVARMASG